jgi:hypothetical protein
MDEAVEVAPAPQPFPPRSIATLMPSRNERVVTCRKCGGENKRGETNCMHCGYLLIPPTEMEEISEIDDKTYQKLSPKFHNDYLRVASQLIVLKILNRIDPYPCQTTIEMDDGSKVKCGQELQFWMEKCPRCKQTNTVVYNCKNKKHGCNAVLPIDAMRCPNPKCKATSMLADVISIVKGYATGGESTIQFVDENIQPIFQQFQMIRSTMRVLIDHKGLIMLKFDLESICERMAKIMKFLALYLESVTKKQGIASMRNVFQISSLQNLSTTPPRRSDDLDALLQERERAIQQGGAAPPAEAAGGGGAGDGGGGGDDDDADDDDDGFDFSIG